MMILPSFDPRHHLSSHPSIGVMVFVSVILHAMAITALFFVPNLTSTRTFYSPVYSVRLVNLAPTLAPERVEPPAAKPQKEPAAVETPKVMEEAKVKEKEPEKPPIPVPEEKKEIAVKKEKPLSLVEKSPAEEKEDAEKKIGEAIERLRSRKEAKSVDEAIDRFRREKENEQVNSEIERLRREKELKQVDSAIERLRSEKQSQQEAQQVASAIESIRKRVTIGGSGAVETSEVASGGSSGVLSIKNKLYYNLIWQRIRNSWVFPVETLGGAKNLETIIAIRIAQDGQITDMQFEKKSGNSLLDESALRAIKKSNPLPPLPPGFEDDHFDVGIRFRPSELQG